MSDFNVVMLSGRLVSDPEMRFTPQGVAVASMRVASSRFYRNRNVDTTEKKDLTERTLFITAESFGKLAESVKTYKKKGDPLMIRGRLQLNEWTGDDGKMKQTYRIVAEEVRFLARNKKNGDNGADAAAATLLRAPAVAAATVERISAAKSEVEETDDDIAF